ncbi:unnamed protein product [Vicia faba]|uniref:Uncharacterized protein n=1 Tax=Vicia faba TaxID=3906 RepID=A0AAV0Z719_VICFA|nr:unnamed protein product [Vicia faba]
MMCHTREQRNNNRRKKVLVLRKLFSMVHYCNSNNSSVSGQIISGKHSKLSSIPGRSLAKKNRICQHVFSFVITYAKTFGVVMLDSQEVLAAIVVKLAKSSKLAIAMPSHKVLGQCLRGFLLQNLYMDSSKKYRVVCQKDLNFHLPRQYHNFQQQQQHTLNDKVFYR